MKLSYAPFISTLVLLPGLVPALALPDIALVKSTLGKRGGEVNFLVDCTNENIWTGATYHVSHIAWDANVDTSWSRFNADSLSDEYRDWSRNNGDWLVWDSKTQIIHFSDSGVTVQTHLDSGADSRAYQDWAGWAQRTSDWKVFQCWRDNNRQIINTLSGSSKLVCNSKYWCM